ncbi:VPS70 [Candida pseudojiufengensis]|uniref:VPS70 n=1 Tax=Candida pseudojiufengensis TaxID=497109 RepID=UPI002224F71C|nr:VPS70 [Candida pseudojiufengensis]KAI5960832.1 VPS70 [Candida pseudojiufengensis]
MIDEKTEVYKAPRARKNISIFKGLLISTIIAILYFNFFNISFPFSIFKTNSPELNPSKIILDSLEINLAGNWSKKYTSEPHLAGTNYPFVEWTEQKFQEFGFDTSIETFEVLLSYPKDHDLKLLDPKGKIIYTAPLKEDIIDEDPTTHNDTIPTFLGYAANGNVTGQYIYANYGTKRDFELLKENDIDVKGKIVVVRYGRIFRGLKVKFAQDEGAIGVLIYTDPGDDGEITVKNGYKQYPKGPARQESSVQRGSVQFLGGEGAAPGDPTTPGYASKPGVERKDPHQSIGKIPVLPISYREVKPILHKLNGHGKTIEGFKGDLDGFNYTTGPTKYELNLYSYQDFNITPIWNVNAEIKGEKSNEVIIIGNHRDAWIKGGAGDPNSGSASLLEVARALGDLKKAGHKFKRSIVLVSLDAEEIGVVGSTEQGEYYAKKYQKEVVAYFNVDVSVSGKNLNLGSSPVLNDLLLETAKKIDYPEGGSLYEHYISNHKYIPTLGSGSDYTVFLEHLGIPSFDLGFSGGKNDPIYHYHSNYDSYHWMEKYGDKDFIYHNVASKYLALLALELSEKELIHFKLNDYAKGLSSYYNQTIYKVPKNWLDKEINFHPKFNLEQYKYMKEITQGHYVTPICKPMQMGIIHDNGEVMHNNNQHHKKTLKDLLHHTHKTLSFFNNVTETYDLKSEELQLEYNNKDELPIWKKFKLFFQIKYHNKGLQYFERNFLYHEGLHKRSWFKHIVFASGRFTGYAGQNLPGLNEAIEDEEFDRFVKWVHILDSTVSRVGHHLLL